MIADLPTVIFTATAETAASYNIYNKIQFPIILTTMGGGYDPTTGVFTAPATGSYIFLVSIYTSGSKDNNCRAQLMRRASGGADTVVVSMLNYDSGAEDYMYYSSIMHGIVSLSRGDTVWVMAARSTCHLYGNSRHYNHFTGALMH